MNIDRRLAALERLASERKGQSEPLPDVFARIQAYREFFGGVGPCPPCPPNTDPHEWGQELQRALERIAENAGPAVPAGAVQPKEKTDD